MVNRMRILLHDRDRLIALECILVESYDKYFSEEDVSKFSGVSHGIKELFIDKPVVLFVTSIGEVIAIPCETVEEAEAYITDIHANGCLEIKVPFLVKVRKSKVKKNLFNLTANEVTFTS